jgi:hypothetical protein
LSLSLANFPLIKINEFPEFQLNIKLSPLNKSARIRANKFALSPNKRELKEEGLGGNKSFVERGSKMSAGA